MTSLRIPGGLASRTWRGLASLAGASPPSQAQGGSQRIGNCRGWRRRGSLHFPPPTLQCPIPALASHPSLRNPKTMGPRIRVSPGLQRSKLFVGTVENKAELLCPRVQLEVRGWLLLFLPLKSCETKPFEGQGPVGGPLSTPCFQRTTWFPPIGPRQQIQKHPLLQA